MRPIFMKACLHGAYRRQAGWRRAWVKYRGMSEIGVIMGLA